jgi:hypothetical protein
MTYFNTKTIEKKKREAWPIRRKIFQLENQLEKTFSVMTYNVLADSYSRYEISGEISGGIPTVRNSHSNGNIEWREFSRKFENIIVRIFSVSRYEISAKFGRNFAGIGPIRPIVGTIGGHTSRSFFQEKLFIGRLCYLFQLETVFFSS